MTTQLHCVIKKKASVSEKKEFPPSVLNKTQSTKCSIDRELNTYLWKNLLSDKDYPILPQLNAVNKMVNGIMHI